MVAALYGRLLPLKPHAAGGIGLGGAAPPSTDVGTGDLMERRLLAAWRPS